MKRILLRKKIWKKDGISNIRGGGGTRRRGIAFYIIQERKKTDSRPFSRRQGPFVFSCGEKKVERRGEEVLVSKVKRRKKRKKGKKEKRRRAD